MSYYWTVFAVLRQLVRPLMVAIIVLIALAFYNIYLNRGTGGKVEPQELLNRLYSIFASFLAVLISVPLFLRLDRFRENQNARRKYVQYSGITDHALTTALNDGFPMVGMTVEQFFMACNDFSIRLVQGTTTIATDKPKTFRAGYVAIVTFSNERVSIVIRE